MVSITNWDRTGVWRIVQSTNWKCTGVHRIVSRSNLNVPDYKEQYRVLNEMYQSMKDDIMYFYWNVAKCKGRYQVPLTLITSRWFRWVIVTRWFSGPDLQTRGHHVSLVQMGQLDRIISRSDLQTRRHHVSLVQMGQLDKMILRPRSSDQRVRNNHVHCTR